MVTAEAKLLTNAVHEVALPLEGFAADHDPLLKLIHEARFCLIGEATHGTHEFYRERDGDHQTIDQREGLYRGSR
jgi:erythromycin esterase-like protein